tara:strand:+ start:75 stop:512 length:438 start_codon:yes stop_codon:yes gene_type:complete
MAKTQRRSGYTTSKGELWGGLRNPKVRRMVRNGEHSPSAELTPTRNSRFVEEEHLYRARDVAYQESLVYYFDEEWFDFKLMDSETKSISGSRIRYTNNPMRCTKCKEGWSVYAEGTKNTIGDFYYLDKESFDNLPLEKKDCPNCE